MAKAKNCSTHSCCAGATAVIRLAHVSPGVAMYMFTLLMEPAWADKRSFPGRENRVDMQRRKVRAVSVSPQCNRRSIETLERNSKQPAQRSLLDVHLITSKDAAEIVFGAGTCKSSLLLV
jgi:hypothetical protein